MTKQPTHYPRYVINPTKPLNLYTNHLPEILAPYSPQFEELFRFLFQRCGFKSENLKIYFLPGAAFPYFAMEIYFPAQQNTTTAKLPKKLDMGNVLDEFSPPETLTEGVNRLRAKGANAEDERDLNKEQADRNDDTDCDIKKEPGQFFECLSLTIVCINRTMITDVCVQH
jgi:hypothetical protein